jgi:uracil-DNA glycosylase
MSVERRILDYQQECYREYARCIGLPEVYTYPDGNPIRPLPPIQTAVGGLMIVGAYPSARFESRKSQDQTGRYRLIPVADNLQPFGYERYFDGVRVRILESADGLRKYLLPDIEMSLDDCWVTDLVKVFLYKSAHRDSCRAVHPEFSVPELRSQFQEFGRESLRWLKVECDLCQPKLVVTLGQEVAQVVSGELSASADALLSRKVSHPMTLGGYATLYLPHPDACRRFDKWRKRMAERVRLVRDALGESSAA